MLNSRRGRWREKERERESYVLCFGLKFQQIPFPDAKSAVWAFEKACNPPSHLGPGWPTAARCLGIDISQSRCHSGGAAADAWARRVPRARRASAAGGSEGHGQIDAGDGERIRKGWERVET